MGSLIGSLATLIALMMMGAFAAPYLVDWNRFKPQIEQYASDTLGRPVRIAGDVRVMLLPQMRFEADGVTISPGADSQPGLLSVRQVSVSLSFGGLVMGRVEASAVALDEPRFNLAVDAAGAGNWSGVTFRPALPDFAVNLPMLVRSVQITNGALTYETGTGTALELSALTASLQTDSAEGPYRVTGSFLSSGERVEIGAVASRSEPATYRLRASANAPGAFTLQFDGTASDLESAPRLKGQIRAFAAIAAPDSRGAAGSVEVQLAGALDAGSARLELTEAEVTLAPNTSPQVLTGQLRVGFDQPEVVLDVTGNAVNWRSATAPAEGNGQPARRLPLSVEPVRAWLERNPDMPVRARFNLQQIYAGDEIVEDVEAVLVRLDGRWLAERASARLPGDTRLTVAGALAGQDTRLSGIVGLEGANLSRFLRWLSPQQGAIDTRFARRFALKGALAVADTALSIEGAAGEIGDSPFTGSLRYDYAGNGKLALKFQSERLTLTELDSLPFLEGGTSFGFGGGEVKATASGLGWLSSLDEVDLDLDLKQVEFRSFRVLDLLARLTLQPGLIDVMSLSFATSDALNVKGSGRLLTSGNAPEGQLRGLLEASTPAAARRALGFVSGAHVAALTPAQLDALVPARVEAQINANRGAGNAGLSLNGTIGGSRITVQGSLVSPPDGGEQTVSIDAEATALEGEALVSQLMTLAGLPAPQARDASPGTLVLRLAGPLRRLEGSLRLSSAPVSATADGAIDASGATLAGEGKVTARMRQPVRYLGAVPFVETLFATEDSADLQASVKRARALWTLSDLAIETAEKRTEGEITIDTSKELPAVQATLRARAVSLPDLISSLLSGAGADPAALATASASTGTVWPQQPFEEAAFRRLTGTVAVTASRIELLDDLALEDGRMTVSLDNGRVALDRLEGELMGGRFRAEGTLTAREGRFALQGRTSLSRIPLARLADGGAAPLVSARLSGSLSFSGEGLSPRGIVSVLEGRGRIALSAGQINGLTPVSIDQVAKAALDAATPVGQAAFNDAVRTAIRDGALRFRAFRSQAKLARGTLSVGNLSFRGRGQTVRARVDIDLLQLALDSEWRLLSRGRGQASWPAVSVVYAGTLADLPRLEAEIAADELYRVVAIRKMERDVERLERLSGPRLGGWSPEPEKVQPAPARPTSPQRGSDAAPQAAGPFTPAFEPVNPARTQAFQDQIRRILEENRQAPPVRGDSSPQADRQDVPVDIPVRRPARP